MKLSTGVLIGFCYIKLLCLIPFDLNLRNVKVKSSKKSICYSICFPVALILIDPYLENVYRKKWFQFNDESFSSYIFLMYGTYISTCFCSFWSIFKTDLIFKIIRALKASFDNLNKFNVAFNYSYYNTKLFLLKFTITQLSLVLLHFIFYVIFFDSFTALLLEVPFVAIKYMLASAFLIKFDAFLILLKAQFSHLNKIIKNIKYNPQNKWERIKNDCEMSDKIDELARLHFILCEISKMFTKKFSIPMISSLAYIFIVIETQFLQIFSHIAVRDRQTRLPVIICIFFWACIRIGELAMVLYDCDDIMKQVRHFWMLNM